MIDLGVFLIVLAALVSALAAVRRDPGLTRREVWIQVSLIALFVAAAIGITTIAVNLSLATDRWLAAAVAGLAIVGIVGGMVAFARYLKSRLTRRSRDEPSA